MEPDDPESTLNTDLLQSAVSYHGQSLLDQLNMEQVNVPRSLLLSLVPASTTSVTPASKSRSLVCSVCNKYLFNIFQVMSSSSEGQLKHGHLIS